jgi:hypothetical protein
VPHRALVTPHDLIKGGPVGPLAARHKRRVAAAAAIAEVGRQTGTRRASLCPCRRRRWAAADGGAPRYIKHLLHLPPLPSCSNRGVLVILMVAGASEKNLNAAGASVAPGSVTTAAPLFRFLSLSCVIMRNDGTTQGPIRKESTFFDEKIVDCRFGGDWPGSAFAAGGLATLPTPISIRARAVTRFR